MWRQGDIYICSIPTIPPDAMRLPHCVLAEGEATGHTHRVAESNGAELLTHSINRYLRVVAESVTIVHPEHGPITLPHGTYRVWQQREYTPQGIRTVVD